MVLICYLRWFSIKYWQEANPNVVAAPRKQNNFSGGWRSRCAREPQPGDYLSIKREDWTLDTMRDLYETVITNYNNTRNKVAWIYEGMQEIGSKVTDKPGKWPFGG